MKKKSTGERLEFYDFSDVTIEHLHRYAIANDFVTGKIVLDIASGEGYGAYILSKNATKVIGVDIDEDSIISAKEKYLNNNLNFLVGSADNIPVQSNTIDLVVSFETIEHHDKHQEMFLEIKRVLKPDGILIMSSPDKKYYSDLTGQANPFHIKELYFEEFRNLVNNNFKFSNFLFQKAYNFNSFISDEESFYKIDIFSGNNSLLKKNLIEPLYNIAIASDQEYIPVNASFFNGKEISDLQTNNILKQEIEFLKNKLYDSNSYKVGSFVLAPFILLKKIIKKIRFRHV